MGKYLRKAKGLRKKENTAKEIQPDSTLQSYIEYLQNKGLKSDKVGIGLFYTNNGLPYTGLIAKEKLKANEIFIDLPK